MKNSLRSIFCAGLLSVSTVHTVLAADSNFTLNLKNADIHSLISTVSKQTGRNFVIDPRVKAKVTVVSAEALDADELYNVFLSVLQVHGYSAVPAGDVTKIVPDVSAKTGPVPVLKNRSINSNDQLVTQVVRIDNVPAAQLVPILRPLVPQQGHLAAYASSNSLVITDRSSNIQRLLDIIKRIDRPDNAEIEIVTLKHASAREVVRILSSLQKTAAKGATTPPGSTRLAADERTNSVLVSGDRAARLRIRGIIANLDTPLESGGNTKVVYLKYANAKDLSDILKGVSDGQAKVTKSQQAGNAKTPSKASSGRANVDIQADENTNALIITAEPDEMDNLVAVIRQLDIRRAQVLVEAIIADISDDQSKSLGVSFATRSNDGSGPGGFSNLGGGANEAIGLANGTATSIGNGLSLALGQLDNNGTDFGFLVRAIASDANNNILSTPSLMTLDNQEAEIIVGQNVPFITGTTTSSNNNNPFQTIERQDIGLTLKVKPQINEGNTIQMNIEQEVSSVASTSQAQASDIVTNKRSIKTTVLIEDGQTLVLGGLTDETLRDNAEKVPVLGDIPILGNLFRYRSTTKVKQNLMIFIHPTIMRDTLTGSIASSEKYNYLRSQQLLANENGIGLLDNAAPILPELDVMFRSRKAPTEAPKTPSE